MLKQRILTALVLLAFLLPALVVKTPWPFALLTLVVMAAAGWEWVRLNGGGSLSVPLGVVLGAACGLALWAGEKPGRVARQGKEHQEGDGVRRPEHADRL